MRVSIEPLSAIPGPMVKDHLVRYGLTPEIIDWKYFDHAFNSGRERGYAWMRDGRVSGMIGLIPFTLAGPAGARDCAWTCDWFVESSVQNPGIGVLLLKGAIDRAERLVTLGGNEATSRLVPRLAVHTDPDAAIEVALPLTVGGTKLFGGLERRLPRAGLGKLGAVPMLRRRPGRKPSGLSVTSQQGIQHAVADLVAETSPEGWTAAYDMGHLQWQLVRCPAVESASASASDGLQVTAASIFWRPKNDRRQWRLALWTRSGADESGLAVLDESARQIQRDGGRSVSAVIGRRDAQTLRLAGAVGFRPTGRSFPFYVLAKDTKAPMTGLGRFGYLDSDLGYRF